MSPWCARLLVLSAVFVGCDGGSGEADGGGLDASALDAGRRDAGPRDAGPRDAEVPTDARVSADAEPDAAPPSCTPPDADEDGHDAIACGGDDCDDADPRRHPDAAEVCDMDDLDEDCDPDTFGDTDLDSDDHVDAACCNGVGAAQRCGDDCADGVPGVHPGVPEVCNGIDDDCDHAIDERLLVTLFADGDGDGFGDVAAPALRCPGSSGFSTLSTDCDDGDVSVFPGATETCDGENDDCDLAIDEGVLTTYYPDGDDDGYGASAGAVQACAPPADHVTTPGDCDDTRNMISPGGMELCNGDDDDCSGEVDDVGPGMCVGVGACRRCGSCTEGEPVSSTFGSAPAPNGSWDLNCDGVVTREHPSDPLTTQTTLDAYCMTLTEAACNETPVVVLSTGGSDPACGGQRITTPIVTICIHTTAAGCRAGSSTMTSVERCR